MFAPELVWYVGLSGVLHGLFIVGAYKDIINHMYSGWLLLIAVWIKVLYEQFSGQNQQVASLIDANVAIDAHLFGSISGAIIVVFFSFCQIYIKLNKRS
ncbi:rhombosortase [Paraglaciecola aquimarina]|uniref:Rhombosortase n=1 Tax=Paraglaciecola aquimarina TaxID=1235557 RepID=A0ABU3SYR8_9ALTE|nr:rhombosortase [Paraglaciecola aquimarina]MDU0355165.1 rhombosortase [Paraglaciecola aquimarina]